MSIYEDYIFARASVSPTSKYFEAFSFIRQKIGLGTLDEIIIQEFSILHNAWPRIYSVAKGETLTQNVLDRFKRGLIEMDRRQVQKQSRYDIEIKPAPIPSPTKVYSESVFIPRGYYKVLGMERIVEWARLQDWWEPWKANRIANSQSSLHDFINGLRCPLYLIESAFSWGITDEGSQYWNKVNIALIEHVEIEIRTFLVVLKNRITIEGPFTIGKKSFFDLTGYGASIYGEEISLKKLCADIGLQLQEAPTDCFTFSLKEEYQSISDV